MLDIIIAAIAGVVSFISPCVLPLVPAYIGYMGGRVTNTVSNQVSVSGGGAAAVQSPSLSMRFSTFIHGLAFVAGFTFIFVLLGLLGTAFVQTVGSTSAVEATIGRVGGVLVIFFGLHFMGALQWVFNFLRRRPVLISTVLTSVVFAVAFYIVVAWGFTNTVALWNTAAYPAWGGIIALIILGGFYLYMFTEGAFTEPAAFWNNFLNRLDMMLYADTRRQMDGDSASRGLPGSALMGVVFAAGWTPCIGPTLGLAFTMAANGGDVGQATALMAAYSLGLGIPFLLTALMLDSAQGMLRGLKTHMRTIKLVSGAFLVFIGVLVASGQLQSISRQFSTQFGDFSIRVEECVIGAVEGDIRLGQTGVCLTGEREFRDLVAENEAEAEADAIEEGESGAALDTGAVSGITDVTEETDLVEGLAVGNLAPNFQTTNLAGEDVSLRDFRGDVVLLNFWATWCGPCRIEMPEFESAFSEYGDEGFTILAVNREEGVSDIQPFVDELSLSFPIALDESGDINAQYNVSSMPTTLILGRDGVVLFRSFGALTEAQIQDLIVDALDDGEIS